MLKISSRFFTLNKVTALTLLFLLFPSSSHLKSTGDVYLVLGSDTAIWDGMDVARFDCYYRDDLYTGPTQNAYQVMNPAFRAPFTDSYGQPLKMTWWMMAGNIYRYASNKDVPVPNTMTLYLMKKYQGKNLQITGDELSLHYHTFIWSDYNQDGKYYWNQSLSFTECLDDFNYTLAQYLLEENIFPVSFRSGWHYMDNDWQQYLDQLLPFSLHNDYPSKRTDTTEPLDNTYDWSLAPSSFIPYRPSPGNYQLPGPGRGWDVRSAHLSTFRYSDLLNQIFNQANQGLDQVACLWGHLPETDFLDNITAIDSIVHRVATQYPDVKFRYCTATEAMQRWLRTTDSIPPQITFSENQTGEEVYFTIQSNEPIFQSNAFVAVKDIYENYTVIPVQSSGTLTWQTTHSLPRNQLAKAGVVVCDTAGNQSSEFISYLPDDIYVDDEDPGYQEIRGNWTDNNIHAWGTRARSTALALNDTVVSRWTFPITQSSLYNLFIQFPAVTNQAESMSCRIYQNDTCLDTINLTAPLVKNDWIYLTTANLEAGATGYCEVEYHGKDQAGKNAIAEVIKVSALVKERQLIVKTPVIDLAEVSLFDTIRFDLEFQNGGTQNLTVEQVQSAHGSVVPDTILPVSIAPMHGFKLRMIFTSTSLGNLQDTIYIHSNDPIHPVFPVPVHADVQEYFAIADNEETSRYLEQGNWYYSNAQAYGASSRYASLNNSAWARFSVNLKLSGVYDIFEIVPVTVNATNHALYVLSINGVVTDSVIIDQNKDSGAWVKVGRYVLPADTPVQLTVIDDRMNTNPQGVVLRADAIKIALIEATNSIDPLASVTPETFYLGPNFPNPFNPITTIPYYLPVVSKIRVLIYNINGQLIRTLIDQNQPSGWHKLQWDGTDQSNVAMSSGIYFYRLFTGENILTGKMILLK